MKISRSAIENLSRLTIICFIILFYFWVASCGTFSFDIRKNFIDSTYKYYNPLVTNLLSGKTYLDIKVPEHILKSPDPYNPANKGIFYYHDISYYKGKFYSYFGISPLITFFIPFKIITHHYSPENLATLFFSLFAFIFSTLILIEFKKRYFEDTPEWMVNISILLLGFSSYLGFLMRRSEVYEVAICSGLCFLTGGIFFLIKGFEDSKTRFPFILLSGIFIGLSLGSRPSFIFTSIVLFIILSIKAKFNLKTISTYLAPFLLIVFILLLYNYLRFENPFEFGHKYQIGNYDLRKQKLFILSNVPFNIYEIFFRTLNVDCNFPFFHLNSIFVPKYIPKPASIVSGAIAGIIPCFPFCLVLIPYIFLIKINSYKKYFSNLDFSIIYLTFTGNLLPLLAYYSQEMRYRADLMIFIIIFTCSFWFYLNSVISKKYVVLINSLSILLCIISIFIGISLSIEMGDMSLHSQNPILFHTLENNSGWLISLSNVIKAILNFIFSTFSDFISCLF